MQHECDDHAPVLSTKESVVLNAAVRRFTARADS